MLEHDEIPAESIPNVDSHFSTHQESTEVVPHTVGVDGTVDEGIERTIGHHTDVEGRGTQGPELPPSGIDRGPTRHRHHCLVPRSLGRRRQRNSVAPRPRATNGPPSGRGVHVSHQRHERPIGVDGTQRRGTVTDTSARVGRAIERIHDDHDVAIEILRTGLFR